VTIPGPGWQIVVTTRLTRDGPAVRADFDELGRAYDDRSFWFVGFTLFSAWGRRPG
jgi:hypothetical protein